MGERGKMLILDYNEDKYRLHGFLHEVSHILGTTHSENTSVVTYKAQGSTRCLWGPSKHLFRGVFEGIISETRRLKHHLGFLHFKGEKTSE